MKYIAEIGWNFIGDLDLAKEMVAASKTAGADFAKFQLWNPNHLKSGPWDSDGRREIYKKAYLDDKKVERLISVCAENEIEFFASVFEIRSLDTLAKIKNDYVKIPSHECNNWALIDNAIEKFGSVFLSVGAISSKDFSQLLDRYSKVDNVTIMHCVSTYPLKSENVNLPKLVRLKDRCGSVGYSSHFTGIEDAVAATALGVSLIEKHFTTSKELPGRDNQFALLPDEFKNMTEACDLVESMLGDLGDDIQPVEVDVANVMRGRWDGKS
jgi:sialic acid synthase SpsE